MHGAQRKMVVMVIFFIILDYFFCFVVAIFDLVHDVEAMVNPRWLLTAYAHETVICSFTGITHISEKISRCC